MFNPADRVRILSSDSSETGNDGHTADEPFFPGEAEFSSSRPRAVIFAFPVLALPCSNEMSKRAMMRKLGSAALLVAIGSSAYAAAPGVDEAAIKAFVADITALSGKNISAFDGKGTAVPAQSASIRRAGPLDFTFSIKTRLATGKISAPQPIALSFRPNEPGMGAGTFMVARLGLVEGRSTRCSGKYGTRGSVRAVDLVCTRMSSTGGFTPGEIVSKMRWEISPDLLEVQLIGADGTVNAIYRTAR